MKAKIKPFRQNRLIPLSLCYVPILETTLVEQPKISMNISKYKSISHGGLTGIDF